MCVLWVSSTLRVLEGGAHIKGSAVYFMCWKHMALPPVAIQAGWLDTPWLRGRSVNR